MVVDKNEKTRTLAHMFNWSFDEDFQQNTVELLGYDGTNLVRIRANASGELQVAGSGGEISEYQLNDIDNGNTTTDVVYLGMEKGDGSWCVKKIDNTTAATPAFQYATVANNGAVTTYSSAWSQIASLTYNDYSVAF